AADGHIAIVTAHTAGDAFHLDANAAATSKVDIDAGVLDIDADAGFTLDATSVAINGTGTSNLTANAANAVLTIAAVGGDASQQLVLNSEGTGAAAINITTTGATGGITINASGGDAAADDFVVVANNFTVTDAGVVIATSFEGGMASGEIKSEDNANAALVIRTTQGGIDITAVGDDEGDDLDITTTGITTEMRLTSASTQADAIDIASDGGIDITAAAAMDITTSAANSNITITPNGAGTLALGTGTNTLVNVTGSKISLTGDGTTADAINLASDGGIDIT
ncbi:uncharacterized protein METZ01_LOCUS403994, partial [marine metagenome]